MTTTELRASFEAWISASSHNYLALKRYPDLPDKLWIGSYQKDSVQLAWEAWQAAFRAGMIEAACLANNGKFSHQHDTVCDTIERTIREAAEELTK